MNASSANPPTPADGADRRDVTHSARRWWALVAIAASVLVVGLDLHTHEALVEGGDDGFDGGGLQ